MQQGHSQVDQVEPLTDATLKSYSLFPITKDQQPIFDAYKKHVSLFWTIDELNFEDLRRDFESLPIDVQHWLKQILSFFASADVLVTSNLLENFISEINNTCCQLFYSIQCAIEAIHSETYSTLIDVCIKDETEKSNMFKAIETMEVIKEKADFCQRRMNQSLPLAERLFCFQLFEGVAFASSFAGIYFIKHQYPGKCKALTESNHFISRDESLHAAFAAMLQSNYIVNKMTNERAHEIVKELMKIERKFCKAVPCTLISINPDQMIKYVEFVCDIQLTDAGFTSLYNHAKCPLEFMTLISLQSKSNFFEKRESSYALHRTSSEAINFDEDF